MTAIQTPPWIIALIQRFPQRAEAQGDLWLSHARALFIFDKIMTLVESIPEYGLINVAIVDLMNVFCRMAFWLWICEGGLPCLERHVCNQFPFVFVTKLFLLFHLIPLLLLIRSRTGGARVNTRFQQRETPRCLIPLKLTLHAFYMPSFYAVSEKTTHPPRTSGGSTENREKNDLNRLKNTAVSNFQSSVLTDDRLFFKPSSAFLVLFWCFSHHSTKTQSPLRCCS